MGNFNSSDRLPLVIDTSVAISLEASGVAADLFRLLGRPVMMVNFASDDLIGLDERVAKVRAAVDTWQQCGLLSIVSLSDPASGMFEDLIVGPSTATLDDGEAATIAHALDVQGVAVIDEAKARSIAKRRFPELALSSTAELLLAQEFSSAIGQDAAAQAIFLALTRSRMRVSPEHIDAVVHLIGRARVAQCHSLPQSVRFKHS